VEVSDRGQKGRSKKRREESLSSRWDGDREEVREVREEKSGDEDSTKDASRLTSTTHVQKRAWIVQAGGKETGRE